MAEHTVPVVLALASTGHALLAEFAAVTDLAFARVAPEKVILEGG